MAIATTYGPRGSEIGMLATERSFARDATRTGFVYCHEFGGDPSRMMLPEYPFQRIVEAGYPFIATMLGGGNTFGSTAAASALPNAITQLTAAGAKTSKVVLVGVSMGTLGLLNSISLGYLSPSAIAAIVLFVPPVYLGRIHDGDRLGLASDIELAYGGPAGYQAAMPAHDPSANVSAFAGIPMKIYAADQDTLALASEAQTFAAALGSPASTEVLVDTTHLTLTGAVSVNRIMAFLAPYL